MRVTLAAAALVALGCLAPPARGEARPAAACAGRYRLEVVDEEGRRLPTFEHAGRNYVLGTRGERYLVRVHNDGARRVEVVVSVDGRDVVDGRPATWEKRGYLVEPRGEVTIDGFRVSTGAVAAFRFSDVRSSYAALRGDARDVGVIGVAVFAEREPPRLALPTPQTGGDAPARAAPDSAAGEGSAPAAPAARAGAEAMRSQDAGRAADRPGLGTAFGERHESFVRRVRFERASPRPDAVLTVRYDDRDGLLAAGVDVDGSRWAYDGDRRLRDHAQPFRGSGAFAEPPPGW